MYIKIQKVKTRMLQKKTPKNPEKLFFHQTVRCVRKPRFIKEQETNEIIGLLVNALSKISLVGPILL